MVSLPSERVILARHNTPDGEIQLQQRPLPDRSLAFEIILNGIFLMASYNQVSERALAHYALEAVQTGPASKLGILVGGLGMGFTLQETLAGPVAAVDVAELNLHIIDWNRTHFAPLNGNALADPRVSLIHDDLHAVLQNSPEASYNAILLDVDNGPSWLAHKNNARLYRRESLDQWSRLLMPGGVFAVWSAQPEPAFLATLRTIFNVAEEIPIIVPGYQNKRAGDFIYRGIRN